MTGTEFLFRNCDGKFTDEDLNAEGNTFISAYFGNNGPYLDDYGNHFGDLLYLASEKEHDYSRFSDIVDRRYEDHSRAIDRADENGGGAT